MRRKPEMNSVMNNFSCEEIHSGKVVSLKCVSIHLKKVDVSIKMDHKDFLLYGYKKSPSDSTELGILFPFL